MSRKTQYYYKLFRIKRSSGMATTISVQPHTYINAIMAFDGNEQLVSDFVRRVAAEYEPSINGNNCSGFVVKELEKEVARRISGNTRLSAISAQLREM